MAANQSGYKPKRSPAVMARREEVWAMYQTGMTQVQIAKETGLTVSTVKSDCAQMRREKRKAA
ncbi:MAG: helix-turn-helix domain-containing protein [Pikeienuella sp.]